MTNVGLLDNEKYGKKFLDDIKNDIKKNRNVRLVVEICEVSF